MENYPMEHWLDVTLLAYLIQLWTSEPRRRNTMGINCTNLESHHCCISSDQDTLTIKHSAAFHLWPSSKKKKKRENKNKKPFQKTLLPFYHLKNKLSALSHWNHNSRPGQCGADGWLNRQPSACTAA